MCPSSFSPDKHDIGIVNTDAVNVGMMLVQRNGIPQYSVFDDEYLASQFFTGIPGYSALPAEKELSLRQDGWRAGFGLDIYDPNDPERYYSGRGMDLRFRGIAFPSNKVVNVAKPTYPTPTVPNANMEATTNWSAGERSSAQANQGTYSWLVPNTTNTASQDLQHIRGAKYTVNADIYDSGAGAAGRVRIDDGVGVTNSGSPSVSGEWQRLSVTRQLNIAASRLRIALDAAGTANSYFDDLSLVLVDAPRGAVNALIEFGDELYAGFGGILANLNAAGDGWTSLANLTNITDLERFPDDRLYLAQGNTEAYSYMNIGKIITQGGAGVNTFPFFKTVHSGSPTMWGASSLYQIRSTTTPNNASSWSGVTVVDSSFHNITDLLAKSGALYIMKEDKPYYLNSSGAVQSDLAPELESLKRSTSGKNAHLWQNKFYIPCGEQGLLEVDGTTLTWLNPSLFSTMLARFTGRVMAVASDEMYLFVAIDDGTQVQILAGREETIGSTTKWVWHPIQELTAQGVETMFVSTQVQKRLWIASTNSSDPLFYIALPTSYGDISNDANRKFATNVAFETPFLHADFKDTKKAFVKLTTLLGHAYNANRYFEAYYRTLENSTYTKIADMKGTSTSMINTAFIPNDGAGNNPATSMFRLKFVANTDDTNIAPILMGYNVKAILYPDQREIIACVVKCADELALKDGTQDIGSADVIEAVLNEARKATWPVTIYDIAGAAQTVKFLPLPTGTARWTIVSNEKNRKLEKHFNVLMQKVPLS